MLCELIERNIAKEKKKKEVKFLQVGKTYCPSLVTFWLNTRLFKKYAYKLFTKNSDIYILYIVLNNVKYWWEIFPNLVNILAVLLSVTDIS